MIAGTTESFTIDGKATIESGFYSYADVEMNSVSFQTTYAGGMTIEVTVRDGVSMDVLLKNVSYNIPLMYVQGGSLGNILLGDIPLKSDGSFSSNDIVVTFSNGSIAGVQSWDASHCYAPYPAEISGRITSEHKLAFDVMFWVHDRNLDNGEFWHKVSFGETLKPFEYRRSVNMGEYGTIVLPFKPSSVSGIEKLYTIVGKQKDEKGKVYSLVLQEASTIEVGVPYIFVSNATEIVITAPGNSERVNAPINIKYSYTDDKGVLIVYDGHYGLQGMFFHIPTHLIGYWEYYMDEWLEEEWFTNYSVSLIEKNRFAYAQSGSVLDAFHAFVLLDNVPIFTGTMDETNALLYSADYNSITTPVSPLGYNESNRTAVFNVLGQKLLRTQKGINIVRGKKVILP